MDRNELTTSMLHCLFYCDADTGILINKVDRGCTAKAGEIAGSINRKGYMIVTVNRKSYLVHRLIWKMIKGSWPINSLDHIDGNTLNNRIINLREATHAENLRNRKVHSNSTTGYPGVHKSYNRHSIKWRAQIMINGKRRNIGSFETIEEAIAARISAESEIHKEFSHHFSRSQNNTTKKTSI